MQDITIYDPMYTLVRTGIIALRWFIERLYLPYEFSMIEVYYFTIQHHAFILYLYKYEKSTSH